MFLVMASKVSWKTEVTGKSAKSCTGFTNKGDKVTFKLGMKVGMISSRDAGDGGDVTYWASGTITGMILTDAEARNLLGDK